MACMFVITISVPKQCQIYFVTKTLVIIRKQIVTYKMLGDKRVTDFHVDTNRDFFRIKTNLDHI